MLKPLPVPRVSCKRVEARPTQSKLKLTGHRLLLAFQEAQEMKIICANLVRRHMWEHPKRGWKNVETRELVDSSQRLVHFKKNFCDCFFCVARQHAFACYYRLRSVISKWHQGKNSWAHHCFNFSFDTHVRWTSIRSTVVRSASQKSAVKPKPVAA